MLYFQLARKIRKEKKIKVKDLAEFLGKSKLSIILWEKGKVQPGAADIHLMAQFLKVSVSDISDLKELKHINNNTETQAVPGFNIEEFSQETAIKLKNLYEASVEQRAANTRLRNETAKYEIMFQNLPFIIYIKDKKLKYKYANDKFLDIAGQNYTKNNISGISNFDIFDFKDQANIQQIIALEERVLRTKEKLSNQQIYIPGTSNQKIGLLTIVPILNVNGEVEEIVCSIEDISDTYEEQERRKDMEAVTNKINHMLWIGESVKNSEDSFRSTFISDSVSEIYGIDKQEFIKDNRLWIKVVHNDDAEMVNNWNIDNWKETDNFPKKIEYKINNPKKGVRWISSEIFKEGRDKFYGIVTDITEEKEKEREKEAILRTLDAASDAIQIAKIKDDSKEYIYLNKENKNLYDLPISKIKNNPDIWKEFIHPDDIRKLLSIDEKREEGHKRINYKLLLPDGKIKYIEENIFREFTNGVLYLGAIKRDVTEERTKDEQIKLLTKVFEDTMNNMDSCILITTNTKSIKENDAFKMLFVNDGFEKLFLTSKQNIIDDPHYLRHFIHPDDIKAVTHWWENVCDTGIRKTTSKKYRIIIPDGTVKLVHDYVKPIGIINGKPVRFGIITDITKEKEKEAKAKLEMLQTILNKLDSCVVITTSDKQKEGHFNYVFISDSIEKLLQVDKNVLFKDPFYLSKILHPEDKDKVNKWWETKAFPGATVPTSLEYRIILPDKSVKLIKDELFPCPQHIENSVRFAIITDITNLQK